MSKHATLSASGAARWLACTPSARLEEYFPESQSDYADEGTAAHELGELTTSYWLGRISESDFENRRNELSHGKYYNTEMQEHANDYARFICDKFKEIAKTCPDAIVELETRVDFSKWVKGGFGTCDCCIIADDMLEIVDLKYGKGHRVDAFENPQMRLYALGAIAHYGILYDIKSVRMTIFQPRLEDGISTDIITVKDLLDWAKNYVKPRAALAYKGEGEFAPSEETCKFCRAKAQCKARAQKNIDLFDNAPDVMLLTVEEAAKLLESASDMKTWLSDLENLITSTLLSGSPVSGWKLVEGKSNRKFVDDLKVAEALKAAGYAEAVIYKPREIITLTQMEKDFGKKKVAEILKDLITKPQGKPTLAPESDKRPALQLEKQILDAFDDSAN